VPVPRFFPDVKFERHSCSFFNIGRESIGPIRGRPFLQTLQIGRLSGSTLDSPLTQVTPNPFFGNVVSSRRSLLHSSSPARPFNFPTLLWLNSCGLKAPILSLLEAANAAEPACVIFSAARREVSDCYIAPGAILSRYGRPTCRLPQFSPPLKLLSVCTFRRDMALALRAIARFQCPPPLEDPRNHTRTAPPPHT